MVLKPACRGIWRPGLAVGKRSIDPYRCDAPMVRTATVQFAATHRDSIDAAHHSVVWRWKNLGAAAVPEFCKTQLVVFMVENATRPLPQSGAQGRITGKTYRAYSLPVS